MSVRRGSSVRYILLLHVYFVPFITAITAILCENMADSLSTDIPCCMCHVTVNVWLTLSLYVGGRKSTAKKQKMHTIVLKFFLIILTKTTIDGTNPQNKTSKRTTKIRLIIISFIHPS